jgi:hypothetical protein
LTPTCSVECSCVHAARRAHDGWMRLGDQVCGKPGPLPSSAPGSVASRRVPRAALRIDALSAMCSQLSSAATCNMQPTTCNTQDTRCTVGRHARDPRLVACATDTATVRSADALSRAQWRCRSRSKRRSQP